MHTYIHTYIYSRTRRAPRRRPSRRPPRRRHMYVCVCVCIYIYIHIYMYTYDIDSLYIHASPSFASRAPSVAPLPPQQDLLVFVIYGAVCAWRGVLLRCHRPPAPAGPAVPLHCASLPFVFPVPALPRGAMDVANKTHIYIYIYIYTHSYIHVLGGRREEVPAAAGAPAAGERGVGWERTNYVSIDLYVYIYIYTYIHI